jgi:hypothetical protein
MGNFHQGQIQVVGGNYFYLQFLAPGGAFFGSGHVFFLIQTHRENRELLLKDFASGAKAIIPARLSIKFKGERGKKHRKNLSGGTILFNSS